jgi:hypothetical protein
MNPFVTLLEASGASGKLKNKKIRKGIFAREKEILVLTG